MIRAAAGMRAAARCTGFYGAAARRAPGAAPLPAVGPAGALVVRLVAAAAPARAQSTGFTPDQAEQFRKLAATVQANVAQGAAAMKAQFGDEFADKVRARCGGSRRV